MRNPDTGLCNKWNPFYADGVYQTNLSINWWKAKKLNPFDFDEDRLKIMNCIHADKNQNVETCDTYWNGIKHLYKPPHPKQLYDTQELLGNYGLNYENSL